MKLGELVKTLDKPLELLLFSTHMRGEEKCNPHAEIFSPGAVAEIPVKPERYEAFEKNSRETQ